MLETILIIILLTTAAMATIIVIRKIPELKEISIAEESSKPRFRNIISGLKQKARQALVFDSRSFEIFLQRVLSKTRCLILKIESRIGAWLQKLRQKSQRKNALKMDGYWQELKKELSHLNIKKGKKEKQENNLP